MSERILQALMQLFAILAKVDYSSSNSSDVDLPEINEQRGVVEQYLKSELTSTLVQEYLKVFDQNFELLNKVRVRKDGGVKKTSLNSVKILRICSEINQELTQVQKKIVLVRILEFVHLNKFSSDQISAFVDTVSDSFNIEREKYKLLQAYVGSDLKQKFDDPRIAYLSSTPIKLDLAKFIPQKGLDAEMRVLRLDSLGVLFVKYYGKDQLFLNGQPVQSSRIQIFSNGSSIKTARSPHVYYHDIISKFLSDDINETITFGVQDLSYKFRNGEVGLHPVSFNASGGQLIGLMGGSGAGKSTFLNVLNGNLTPATGKVCINGLNVHEEKNKLEGKIGFISQDDVLIEDLTVYENLFFNTKLCFKSNSDQEIHKKVIKALIEVGLYDVKRFKVGNAMDKTISGGQRKRLNIALELIREPSVLYIDEPTSGLSSKDSEKIMDLLKELSLKGKLLFVVIHQPSSEIYKMFDRLFVLDTGGYTIFDGNPSDAIVYFKVHANHVNAEERECPECGKVNPEEIFNIIEAKIVNELGILTTTRKKTPKEWCDQYNKLNSKVPTESKRVEFESAYFKPNKFNQFLVYFKRDSLSKWSNKQYILLNLLEAPILAYFLAFFLKYFGEEGASGLEYSFYTNENIPQYLFICVIVSLFLGLAVSAEEIIKDRLLLKRESFLNLSRSSYLLSKISILFIISAVQSILFVLIGNYLLEIPDMWMKFWFILFTTSCMANLLGLLISSMFKTAKVIYIFIPLVIIPQLLFSGVIVKFDRLHPIFTSQKKVPLIGNLMTSRWAYGALSTSLYMNNPNEKKTYKQEIIKEEASWKRDYWLPEIKRTIEALKEGSLSGEEKTQAKDLIQNEIAKETLRWSDFNCPNCFEDNTLNYSAIEDYTKRLGIYYSRKYTQSSARIEEIKRIIGKKEYSRINSAYQNESLERLVKNSNELDKLVIWNGEMIQKSNPIYRNTENLSFLNTPLYASSKNFMGIQLASYWVNAMVIWFFTLFIYVLLYFDLGKRLMSEIGKITRKIKKPQFFN